MKPENAAMATASLSLMRARRIGEAGSPRQTRGSSSGKAWALFLRDPAMPRVDLARDGSTSERDTGKDEEKTMHRKIFVNVAVRNLPQALAFWKGLGFRFNAQFTNDAGACMELSSEASVMLLTHERFKDFTKKPIVDSTKQTEAILCLSADSRAEVDALVRKALETGGTAANPPMDHGFMYGASFHDPDGHLWEVMWMDAAALATG